MDEGMSCSHSLLGLLKLVFIAIVPMDHSGSGKKHKLIMDNVSVRGC